MNSLLVSVIVPVFKTKEYLGQCVQSLRSQSYSNLEIILVDDGSPDDCPAICDTLATQDTRIRVIHKENEGAALARKAGLDAASGQYVLSVDSDDWLEKDCLEKLYKDKNLRIKLSENCKNTDYSNSSELENLYNIFD